MAATIAPYVAYPMTATVSRIGPEVDDAALGNRYTPKRKIP